MNEQKKSLMLTVLAIITLLAVVIGATYAFFTAGLGPSVTVQTEVTTKTTDSLMFATGEAINIYATQDNFKKGGNDILAETEATVSLRANNDTNEATYSYYVYLKISANDFEYTTSDNKPELLLTILDPNNQPLTSITGLDYVTIGEGEDAISGFDVTITDGIIEIANERSITTTTETSETWTIALTLINLDTNQIGNAEKTFNAEVLIQKDKIN